ncbi:MAG: Sapep family Mn(2+)-dependent dipeptidase [Christensenellaceae bacterium]|jgi:succinyl-diaminopimelate desuccinylase|nr:Sapep family Mn(2+)-dependent dipeptidase [Christensenellaceae bacterium]
MPSRTDQWLQNHRAALTASLQEILCIPSIKGEPAPGAPFGKDVKRALDAALSLAGSLGLATKNLEGYIGYAECGQGKEQLGILAHLDVVGTGAGWVYPPFSATVAEGKLFGRGAMDDKGPAVAALYALAAVQASGLPFTRRVRILLGCDEESGWGCMRHYAQVERMPDLAFSPDADYPLVSGEKHLCQLRFRGAFDSNITIQSGDTINIVPDFAVAEVPLDAALAAPLCAPYQAACTPLPSGCRIAIKGASAHASTPELGENALQKLLELLCKLPLTGKDAEMLAALHGLFARDLHGESLGQSCEDASGRLTQNVAILSWGKQGIAELALDYRLPISKDLETLKEAVAGSLAPLGLTLFAQDCKPGYYVEPTSELVRTLLGVYRARTGDFSPPLTIGGGTYARCIPNAVAFGCERPGEPNNIHQANEYIALDALFEDACMMADAIAALACEG